MWFEIRFKSSGICSYSHTSKWDEALLSVIHL